MESTVTAVELARHLGVDPKRLRRWLRDHSAAGHRLLAPHQHGHSWVFSPAEAKSLAEEFRYGTRSAVPNTPAASPAPPHPAQPKGGAVHVPTPEQAVRE